MIDYQEFLEAGFTEAQASALQRALLRYVAVMDHTSAQRFSLLQEALNEGFVRLEQSMDRQFANVEERLERIDEHLQRPGRNGS